MAGPDAARAYLQTLGVLDRSGRPASRRRPRAGIDIDEVETIGAEREDETETPPTRETVVDEIEIIGDPNASSSDETAALDALADAPPAGIPPEWIRARSHGDYSRPSLPSGADFAEGFDRAQAEERARAEHARLRNTHDYRAGNVRAGLPSFVPDVAVDAVMAADALAPGVATVFDPETIGAAEHGVAQGLTFGHEDEIAGAVRSGAWRPGMDAETGRRYREERDRVRAQQDDAQRGDPLMYGAAEVLGGLPATMAVPGAGPGASLTRRMLTSGLVGAGFGAASGSGHSRGEFGDDEYIGDVASETALGAGTGAGMELGMEGLRAARRRLSPPPEGTPPPGGDFTPEQRAEARRRMDAGDPDVFDAMQTRDALEDAAAARRVRSTADSAALADVRRAADYHGPGGEGYRGLARDLDMTGVSPRGSITRASTAQQRAARLGDRAGRDINAVTERMDAAARPLDLDTPLLANADDELDTMFAEANARGRAIRAAEVRAEQEAADAAADEALRRDMSEPRTDPGRGGRARPQGVSMRERPVDVDVEPTERQSFAGLLDDVEEAPPPDLEALARDARRSVVLATDRARVRYSPTGGQTEIVTPTGRELPDQGTTVERLLRQARDMSRRATTAEQHAAAAQMEALAREIDQIEPELYSDALARLRGLDDEAAYGSRFPGAATVTPERISRAREARRGVRADMDRAVEQTLGSDELARLRAARARSGVAQTVDQLSERGAAREAANRQVGLTDTLAVTAAANRDPAAGPLQRAWNAAEALVVNRYLRGLEHTTVAAWQEAQSDAMAREIVRRLAERPVTAPMARALAEAARRGPRAFGIALVTLGRQSPEAQAEIVSAVRPAGSDPYEEIEGVEYDDAIEDSAPMGRDPYEDIEGVQYDDDEDDALEQRRRQ